MGRNVQTTCTRCGQRPGGEGASDEEARDSLYVMKVDFRKLGKNGSVVRSRTIAWLCRRCMVNDPIYNQAQNAVVLNQMVHNG